jgi:SAM-dependent methyltransferase
MSLRETLAGSRVARTLMRRASDWIDLQYSLVVSSLRQVAPQARGRLLDVGCGNKPYEAFFRPHVTSYLGIEHEATFAATAADSDGARPDLTYDGQRLPFEDGSFDTVLSVQVLEHTPKPRHLVFEMARVLADDGLLILLAPFQFRLHEQPHDYYRYSSHGLRHLCEDAGLTVERIDAQGSLWSVIGQLGHEQVTMARPRLWTLPLVGASMVGVAAAARALDALATDPDEMLNFMILARKRRAG